MISKNEMERIAAYIVELRRQDVEEIAQLKEDIRRITRLALGVIERSIRGPAGYMAAANLGLEPDAPSGPPKREEGGKLEPGRNFLEERMADTEHDRVPNWMQN